MAISIVELQKRDHAHLEALLARFEAEGAEPARSATFRELVDLVTTHAFAEEEVLFPIARRLLGVGEPLTAQIESEHQRINELLEELQGLSPGRPGFDTRTAELFPLLRVDLRNEEDRLLGPLEKRLTEGQLKRLGAAWALAKRLAPNRAHPRIPRRPPGNVLVGMPLFVVDRLRGLVARLRSAPR